MLVGEPGQGFEERIHPRALIFVYTRNSLTMGDAGRVLDRRPIDTCLLSTVLVVTQTSCKENCPSVSSLDVHRLQSRAFGPAPSHGSSSRFIFSVSICLQAGCTTNTIVTPFLLHIDTYTATCYKSYPRNGCANWAALEFCKDALLQIDTILGLSYTRSVCEAGRKLDGTRILYGA